MNDNTHFFSKWLHLAKKYVVALGPHHFITQSIIKLYGILKGYKTQFRNSKLVITKGKKAFIIKEKDFALALFIFNQAFPQRFREFRASVLDGREQFDCSGDGEYEHINSGEKFYFPSIPEDDSFSAYTSHFSLEEGMVVFDAGAHAGMTTYFLSKAVGGTGHVYAFEPDDQNFKFLEKNINAKNISNTTLLKSALGRSSGIRSFNRDGTLASGFSNSVAHPNKELETKVNVLSLQDACTQLGVIPNFIKMDIEGAEIEVIEKALDFIKEHHIHFAIDTFHWMPDGSLTRHRVEQLFHSIGYQVESAYVHHELLTWAGPFFNLKR